MISILVHVGLELGGQGCWACVRGRCAHRHHRWLGDGFLVLALAVLTVHLVG